MSSGVEMMKKYSMAEVDISMNAEDLQANINGFNKQLIEQKAIYDKMDLSTPSEELFKQGRAVAEIEAKIKLYTKELDRVNLQNKLFGASLNKADGQVNKLSKSFAVLKKDLAGLQGPLGAVASGALSSISSLGGMGKSLLTFASANPIILALTVSITALYKAASIGYNHFRDNTLEGNKRIREDIEISAAKTAWWGEQFIKLGANVDDFGKKWKIVSGFVAPILKSLFTWDSTSIKQYATLVSDAIEVADKLTEAETKRRENTVANAKLESEIAEREYLIRSGFYVKDGKEYKATNADKLKALDEMEEMQKQVSENNIKALTLEYEAIKLRNAMASSGEKDMMAEAKAEEAIIRANTQLISQQKQLIRLRASIKGDKKDETPTYERGGMTPLEVPVLPRFEVPNGIPSELEGYFDTAQSVLNRGLMELQNQSTEYMQGKSLLDVLFGGDEVVDNKMEQFQLQQMNMVIASNEAMLAMTTLTEEERTAIEQENSDKIGRAHV